MNKEKILAELAEIFREVLDDGPMDLRLETTADDVEKWDSLAHMQLALAIGKHFGVKFTTAEIVSWGNVGAIVDCVAVHIL